MLSGRSDTGYHSEVWQNNGDGTFSNVGANLMGVEGGTAAWGDYDNDNRLDILLTGAYYDGTWHDVTKVYRNDGWAFHEVQTGLPQIAGAASWVDFDNDRDLDILLAGDTGDSARATEIWRNDDCTDLAVSKWANTTSIAPGQAITYTVVYTNNGPGPTHGVILTDIVSPVLHGVSYSSSGALITPTGAANYVWEVADLDAGEGGTITLTGVIDPDVPGCWGVSNEAEIYSYLDTDPTNNRAEVWAGTPLNTVAVNPTRNETAIDLTTDIQATLDTPVAADTVSGRTFAAQGMMGGLLTGTYDVEGGVVTLDPDRSLFPNEVVRTTLAVVWSAPAGAAWCRPNGSSPPGR